MKLKTIVLGALLMPIFAVTRPMLAEESTVEKVETKMNDAKRSTKKKIHRVEEEKCKGTPKECQKQKAKHRTQEAKDAAKDKATEIKNKVD